jgi:hypothetical protein
MLTSAPSDAAKPTKNASSGFPVRPATAKIGASVETALSINLSKAGWTFCKTKLLWFPRFGFIDKNIFLSSLILEFKKRFRATHFTAFSL